MLDAYRDLIDGLSEASASLRELLGDPVPDDLPGEALALLKEVRAREAAVFTRSQHIMRGENVNLRELSSEPGVRAAASIEGTPDEIMRAFLIDRGELVSLLINLTLNNWERKVSHYVLGETNMVDEIENYLTWQEDMLENMGSLIA